MSIAEMPLAEIEEFAAFRAARQEPEEREFINNAVVRTISIYRHLGAVVTFAGFSGGEETLERHKLLWVYVAESGPTVVCHTLHALSMAIAADAKSSGFGGDLSYDWWMPPNPNANNADDWVLAGSTKHDLSTFIRYLDQKAAAA